MSDASLPTRVAIRARRAAARALHLLDLGLDAATLGLFSDAQLDALTASYYDGAATYTADGHNEQGLFDWERQAMDDFFPPTGKVLVTSAGGGREALALLERGYEVVATECVESLYRALATSLAAASHGTAHALLLPPDAVPTTHGPFEAAVAGWTAYTHLTGRAVRVAFLGRLLAVLRPGAPALVSYWGRPDAAARASHATAALANLLRRLLGRRTIEPGETTRHDHHQRGCAVGEVPDEAREAGFEVVDECWNGCPHVLLRRPATP
ncbi:MAG: hypothetical protein HY906_17230 [Deltaproteobacteria bacterium]|nr:hypothetical protein [Deltaproteobacteria bacterium]